MDGVAGYGVAGYGEAGYGEAGYGVAGYGVERYGVEGYGGGMGTFREDRFSREEADYVSAGMGAEFSGYGGGAFDGMALSDHFLHEYYTNVSIFTFN